jgi:phage portal protein
MGLINKLFKSRDQPKIDNRTVGSSYSFYMGGSSAGKNVNERSAMQMTAVYSCVRILAEAVAGLPLHLYRYKEDG